MSLLKTALLAVLFGSLYTIFRKYQTIVDLPQAETFNQPLYFESYFSFQSFIIFVGMSTILMFRPWMKQKEEKVSELPRDNMMIYLMPSFLDVLGTIVDTSGLYYTSVSVSQMLKGSVLFFTYIITIVYLKKSLPLKKHLLMIVILASLTLIGVSNINTQNHVKFESNPILGNVLIILSQFLFSLMFIYQEKILKRYHVRVENAVFWEGIWGVLISGIALALFSVIETPIESKVVESCILICTNYKLLLAVILTALCIGPFNYFGISLTKEGSALQRCIICTSRMIVVWTVSLVFGWQQFRILQLIGYTVLTYCIFQFNKQEKEEQILQNAELSLDQESHLNSQEEKCSN